LASPRFSYTSSVTIAGGDGSTVMDSIVEAAMEEAVDEGAGELTKEAAVLVLRLRNRKFNILQIN
jgi:hypothetical protein